MFFKASIISGGGILFGYKLAILCGINRWFRLPFTIDSVSEYLLAGLTICGFLTGVVISWSVSKRLSHWKMLVWVTALYLITAIGSSLSPDLYLLSFFIGAGGICLGSTIVTFPLYVTEVVPVLFQSRTTILFSVTTVLSIQLTYMLIPVYTIYWRWIPAGEALVSFCLMLALFTIPDQARQATAKPQITGKETSEHAAGLPFSNQRQTVVSGPGLSGK